MKSSQWISQPGSMVKPNPSAAMRLFCFHHAGGNPSVFRPWAEHLPESIELCCMQLPGRCGQAHEAPFTRMAPLVDSLARTIEPFLDKPFIFFGHSMGALIGFELARHLRRQGASLPMRLLVSGHSAPQLPYPGPPIHGLPDETFLECVRGYNGTPEEALQHEEWLELLLPVLRADFEVCETYSYTDEAPLECPITALGGLQDSMVPEQSIRAWSEQTCAAFDKHMFPGDHFYLLERPQLLLWTLARILAQEARNVA